MSVRSRDFLPVALGFVAVATLIWALLLRPHPLPVGSARYPVPTASGRPQYSGPSYAIDAISAGNDHVTYGTPIVAAPGTPVIITGWAVDPRNLGALDHLIVTIDGTLRVTVGRCHDPRPDVATALGSPAAASSGFLATIPTGRLKPGSHRASLVAIARDHRSFPLPAIVSITIAQP